MNAAVPVPEWWGVALAAVLIVATAVVALRERLGLGRDIAEAAVRAVVQLVAVGFLLRVLFERAGIPGSLGWVAGMVVLAGSTAGRRARGLPGAVRAATIGIATGVTLTVGVVVGAGILEAEPRIVVPVGGIIVSAAMQGTTIVLARLRDEIASSRQQVEARLVLGLPGRAAFAPHRRLALRAAISPGIDQTKVVGLIALPGTMTGLIIAGVSPLTAIRYQIVVQYMWLGSVAISGLVASRLASRTAFDEAHRLRPLAAAPARRGERRRGPRWRDTRPGPG
ncbi:MAG TPA: ABC transporter permease [Frankiaceae bacterium]|nr:ABC transporter permease [Frankiaceae bacterium]